MENSNAPACDLSGMIRLSDDQVAQYQDRNLINKLFTSLSTIAIVGLSTNPIKDSHRVAEFLLNQGIKVIPVHPKADRILGEKVYSQVKDIQESVDIVNIFRPSHECAHHAEQAVKIGAKAIWLQLNIFSEEVAQIGSDSGMEVIMNLCIMIEYKHFLNARSIN
ncbi:MAG: CoA-binding protein [Bacteroidetes bacterium]|nr:CoA-binding protein [Bacteroidota bacterium]MCY4232483.1 CoA-binding protein [Bacteroidota bacterium]